MSECPFCQMVMQAVTEGIGIEEVGRSGVYHFEPLNPVTKGHRLFIPAYHYENAAQNPLVTGDVFCYAAQWAAQRDDVDFNLIVNSGPSASQTIKHLHIHYVPRRQDDGLLLPWSAQHGALAEHDRQVKAEAWDEGHKHSQRLGRDECQCNAWNIGECACGLYGTGELLSLNDNPYRKVME